MAKRQTRRSISVKGITYQRLKDYCEDNGLSVSGYLEDIIAEKLDAAGAPVPTVVKREPPPAPSASASTSTNTNVGPRESNTNSNKPAEVDEIVSQHFTF
jgi:hypothetical protein